MRVNLVRFMLLNLFCVVFCRSLFVLFLLAIVLSVLLFVDHCVSFCSFSFGYCIVCPYIYNFWLPICYLQTFLLKRYWYIVFYSSTCKLSLKQRWIVLYIVMWWNSPSDEQFVYFSSPNIFCFHCHLFFCCVCELLLNQL